MGIADSIETKKMAHRHGLGYFLAQLSCLMLDDTQLEKDDLVAKLNNAQKELRRYRELLESIADNVWVTSADGNESAIIAGNKRNGGPRSTSIEEALARAHPDDANLLQSVLKHALESRKPLDHVVRFSQGPNEWKALRIHGKPLFEDGKLVEWVGVSLDVTRAEQAEAELRQQQKTLLASQERLTLALQASSMGVWEFDILTGKASWSPEVNFILGVDLGAKAYPIHAQVVHPEDLERVSASFRDALNSNQIFKIECRIVRDDGRTRWIRILGRTIFDGDVSDPHPTFDRPTRMIGTVQDISAERHADDCLKMQNQILHQIASNIPLQQVLDGIIALLEAGIEDSIGSLMLIDSHQRLRFAAGNRLDKEYIAAVDGLEPGPSIGSCGTAAYTRKVVIVDDIATDSLWNGYQELAAKFGLASCWSFPIYAPVRDRSLGPSEQPLTHVQGAFAVYRTKPSKPTESEWKMIEQVVQLAAIALEKHRSEQSLLESEKRFRELANAMPQLVWTADQEGNYVYSNKKLLDTIGHVSNLDWDRVVHPEDRDEAYARFEHSRTTGQPFAIEYRLKNISNGEYRWYLARAIASRNEQGEITCWYGAATDIDELKRTEKALREERDRLTAIAEASPSALFSFMELPNGLRRFPYAAPSLYDVWGVTPEEVFYDATPALSLISPLDEDNLIETVRRSAASSTSVHTEFRVNHPRKGVIWIECLASPRTGPNDAICWHGILTDVTQRKLLESRLLQTEKMEAIGRLAGGIAHDFNNLLTVVIGTCHLLAIQLNGNEAELSNVEAIRLASLRAAGLTKQLLAFSRQQEIVPQNIDFNTIIRQSEFILKRLVGNDVSLELQLEDSLSPVFADPTQLEQILINLVINSRDAIPGVGKISIATTNCTRPSPALGNSHPQQALDYVCVTVSDTGHGIPDEVQSRIFDPFFTTKPIGKGTGLGLAVVHGIATQNGGFAEVESRMNEGATFRIYLPVSKLGTELPAAATSSYLGMIAGTETVLIVDDEPSIASIAAKTLEPLGYTIRMAYSVEEAKRLLAAATESIDVLVTDLAMPDGNGLDLAGEFRRVHPRGKVIYMSGMGQTNPGDPLDSGSAFLPKPFTPSELALQLRQLLERQSAEGP